MMCFWLLLALIYQVPIWFCTRVGTLCLTTEQQAVDVVILFGFVCSVEAVVLFIFYVRHVFGIS